DINTYTGDTLYIHKFKG
nr:anti-bacterial ssDNA antibody heavy chain CDR2 region [mice, BALB/c, hybridoma SECF4/6, Peptide Partial, 17 aa] [Mus sp.]